jgi:hypothetical protein
MERYQNNNTHEYGLLLVWQSDFYFRFLYVIFNFTSHQLFSDFFLFASIGACSDLLRCQTDRLKPDNGGQHRRAVANISICFD